MFFQQNWSPIIKDCVFFKKYNQEHKLSTKINYDNPFSIYKLFLNDDIIDFIYLKLTNIMKNVRHKHLHQFLENTNNSGHQQSEMK